MAAPKGNQFAAGNPGGGRPSNFKEEFLPIAQKMCELGATDAELADAFGVSIRTIGNWRLTIDEFSAVLKTGKAYADDRVEQSLYKRAMGYEADEVDIRVINGEIVKTPIRKFYPPDTTAMIFWLKNRRSQEWRDVKEVKMSRDLKEMTNEELLAIAAGSGSGDSEKAQGPGKPAKLH